jgi:hypothetical protein
MEHPNEVKKSYRLLLHEFPRFQCSVFPVLLYIKSQVGSTYKYPSFYIRARLTMYNSTEHVVSLVLGVALVEICSLDESLTIFGKGPADPAAPYTPNRVTIVNPHTTIHQR